MCFLALKINSTTIDIVALLKKEEKNSSSRYKKKLEFCPG